MVYAIRYGMGSNKVAVFATREALVAHFDPEWREEMSEACDAADAYPGDAVDAGDGDLLTLTELIGAD
jgi:hypothetical protein